MTGVVLYDNTIIIQKCKKINYYSTNTDKIMLQSFNDFVKGNLFINSIQNQLSKDAIASGEPNEWFSGVVDNITYGSAYTPGSNGYSTGTNSNPTYIIKRNDNTDAILNTDYFIATPSDTLISKGYTTGICFKNSSYTYTLTFNGLTTSSEVSMGIVGGGGGGGAGGIMINTGAGSIGGGGGGGGGSYGVYTSSPPTDYIFKITVGKGGLSGTGGGNGGNASDSQISGNGISTRTGYGGGGGGYGYNTKGGYGGDGKASGGTNRGILGSFEASSTTVEVGGTLNIINPIIYVGAGGGGGGGSKYNTPPYSNGYWDLYTGSSAQLNGGGGGGGGSACSVLAWLDSSYFSGHGNGSSCNTTYGGGGVGFNGGYVDRYSIFGGNGGGGAFGGGGGGGGSYWYYDDINITPGKGGTGGAGLAIICY